MNKFTLFGRLTDNVKIKTTEDDTKIGTFSLAVNRNIKDEVDFIPLTVFNKSAETLEKYVKKGEQLLVEGKIQQYVYADASGSNRTAFNFIVDRFYFISNGKNKINDVSDDGELPFDFE